MAKRRDKERAKWGAVAGGVSGAVSGGAIGGYVGALHPKAIGSYMGEAMKQGVRQVTESMQGEFGEGWKPEGWGAEKPFQKGPFNPEEAMARIRFAKQKAIKRQALRRIGKYSAAGALGLGSLGALAGYASVRSGKQHQRQFSKRLDDLIQFQMNDKEETKAARLARLALVGGGTGAVATGLAGLAAYKHPVAGLMAAKAGILPGAAVGLGYGLLKRPKKRAVEELSATLDKLIQFQDPRPRNQLGEFTSQTEGPDPNAMVKTYRSGLHRGLIEGGTTALIGGAAGFAGSSAAKAIGRQIRNIRKARSVSRIITP